MFNVKEYQSRLLEGVKQFLESNNFQEFMHFSATFHSYSFGNILMIWSQRSGASRVAGIKTWNSLGRCIRKGEKGIAIFAPMIAERQKEDILDNDGVINQKTLTGFSQVYVFDVSQTEGKDLPVFDIGKPVMDGNADALVERILQISPVPVELEDMTEGRNGYYAQEKRIALSTSLNAAEKAKTLLHELAHHLTHEKNIEGLDRANKEIIAEGSAYVGAAYFGFDASNYSPAYLANWGQDYLKIFSTCQIMHDIATDLITMMNNSRFLPL
ncbi:MAG: ImmA/IrrE family metallo-endopeptidase [Deltaproteobacteria bacterium]|nr:ImmA/IrrE family metallo-endopeptidase [Deltaproteobacteria bacterium]